MTGEMSKDEVTRESFPLHFAAADAYKHLGATVEPFDKYQGPYVLVPGKGRSFLYGEEPLLYWANTEMHRGSGKFGYSSADLAHRSAADAFKDLIDNGGLPLDEEGNLVEPEGPVSPIHYNRDGKPRCLMGDEGPIVELPIEEDEPAPESKIKYIAGTKFINVYLCDRAYGGPEEGGWYYDTRQIIRCTQVLGAEAEIRSQAERTWCVKENSERRSDTGSVLSEGRYEVYVDDKPGADYPTERPHYE